MHLDRICKGPTFDNLQRVFQERSLQQIATHFGMRFKHSSIRPEHGQSADTDHLMVRLISQAYDHIPFFVKSRSFEGKRLRKGFALNFEVGGDEMDHLYFVLCTWYLVEKRKWVRGKEPI